MTPADGLARIVDAAYAEAPVRGHQRTEVYDWPRFSAELLGPEPDPEHYVRRFYMAPAGVPVFVNKRLVFVDQMELVTNEAGEARLDYTARNRGRTATDPLVAHADALGAAWVLYGAEITYAKLAEYLRKGDRTVDDWFRGGRWMPYKRTGSLPKSGE